MIENKHEKGIGYNMDLQVKKRTRASNRSLFLKMFVVIVIVGILAIVGLSIFVSWQLTHPIHRPLNDSPDKYGLQYEDITFTSTDKIILSGWMINASGEASNKTIIFAHSYANNRLEESYGVLKLSKVLSDKGFNVLLFDFRNSGQSEGNLTTVGYNEKKDLLAAIEYVKTNSPDSSIGILGVSMGASVSIMAAAESEDIQAVIADSPYANLGDLLKENLTNWTGLPRIPFSKIIISIFPFITGIDPNEVSPENMIGRIKANVLLIHGNKDNSISINHSKRLLNRAMENKAELWAVDGADHVGSYGANPSKYEEKVVDFFMDNL